MNRFKYKKMQSIQVAIDFKSAECYLSIPVVLQLASESNLQVTFLPFLIHQTEYGRYNVEDQKVDTTKIKSIHYAKKNPYLYKILKYEAAVLNLPFHAHSKSTLNTAPALAGLLYLNESNLNQSVIHQYVKLCFLAIFGGTTSHQDIENIATIQQIFSSINIQPGEFTKWYTTRSTTTPGFVLETSMQLGDKYNLFAVPTFIYNNTDTTWPREKQLMKHGTHEIFTGRWSIDLLKKLFRRSGRLPTLIQPPLLLSFPSASIQTTIPRLQVDYYLDIKSPYAYLAIEPLRKMRLQYPHVYFNCLPFALDIPSYLGTATVGVKNNIVQKNNKDKRSPKQWRAVKYAYADVRRRGALQIPKVTIYGTQKIWNSTMAGICLLWIKKQYPMQSMQYIMIDKWQHVAWPLFWKRNLNIEDPLVLQSLMKSCDIPIDGFMEYLNNEGLQLNNHIRQQAFDELGIFGVPSMLIRKAGQIIHPGVLWGSEHFDTVRQLLNQNGVSIPNVPLNSDRTMPSFAFGTGTTWFKGKQSKEKLVRCVKEALNVGIRHIDAAEMYETEIECGTAIHEWLKSNNNKFHITRKHLFVTSKLSTSLNTTKGIGVHAGCHAILFRLGLQYLNLLLIHAPFKQYIADGQQGIVRIWQEMEELVHQGVVESIGVSNFSIDNLKTIIQTCTIKPSVNQIEHHILLQQPELVAYCHHHGIVITSYSGLAPITKGTLSTVGSVVDSHLLKYIESLAAKYTVEKTHVLQRWILQSGHKSIVTTSKTIERIQNMLKTFDFELNEKEMNEMERFATKIPQERYFFVEELGQELNLLDSTEGSKTRSSSTTGSKM